MDGEARLKVLIAGGGKGLPAVREMVSQLGLADTEICPPVPLHQLVLLLARGDIHLICQKPGTEGLLVPSKIYSTLAAGRPSIFIGPLDCEVGRIVQESESGFVIQPGDVETARAVLRQLATSLSLRRRMGRNAREYYEEHFGRDRSVSSIVGILEAAGNGDNGNGHKRGAKPVAKARSQGAGRAKKRSRVMRRIRVLFDRRRLVVTGVAMIAVLAATHIPQELMPKELSVRMLDKVEHVAAYGLVVFLLLLSFRKPPGLKTMAVILLIAGLTGMADEMTQPWVHRTASHTDWAADLVGVALTCGLFSLIRLWQRERLLRSTLQT